jgi:selenocysteine lyase/cysteine desulfurase
MHQKLYSRFLSHLGDRLHFAAHSHHAWPDVSRDAHIRYWDDSAKWMDHKWAHIFSEVMPHSQQTIARLLHLKNEKQIAFAPNTHELVMRLLSTFPNGKPIRILTSMNEFHSFRRQIQRMEESGTVQVDRVQADDLAVNRALFLDQLKQKLHAVDYDLFFISQVFFDSGLALTTDDLLELAQAAKPETVICIDGYHSFGALPVDWSRLEGRAFYLGGGYKYAQAGEGACFMVVPQGDWRPVYTGWFAEMETLSGPKHHGIAYPTNGSAFAGSTFDPSGFYRFNAVWDHFQDQQITLAAIHAHVLQLQDRFIQGAAHTLLKQERLMNAESPRGHFLTYDLGSADRCAKIHALLESKGILTDYRGQRLRFGFGIYQSESDVEKLIERLRS